MDAKELASEIQAFLAKYGKRSASEPEEWSSPDAYLMEHCAKMLEAGKLPRMPHSGWESGGYGPYMSKEGRELHDELLVKIGAFIKGKGND